MPTNLPISVNQNPAYGDRTIIDNLKRNTKPLPISGAPAPARGPGRPSKGVKLQGPAGPPAGTSVEVPPVSTRLVPQAHQDMANDVAAKHAVALQWQQLAQLPGAGPWTQLYAQEAQRQFEQSALGYYRSTPNFE